MPQWASRSRIQSKGIVCRGDVHDPVDDHRSCFETLRIARMEDPRGAQLRNVLWIDFVQTTEAAPCVVAVIGSPICADRLREQIVCTHVHGGGDRRLLLLCHGWRAGESERGNQGQGEYLAPRIHFPSFPSDPTRNSWKEPRSNPVKSSR